MTVGPTSMESTNLGLKMLGKKFPEREVLIHVYNQQFPTYNYYPQAQSRYLAQQPQFQQQPQQQQFNGLRGRPVASIEEARASMIDFDGSVFYFPDLANNKIYTKQINMDGTSSLYVYERETSQAQIPSYVSQEEFQSTIKILLDEIDKLKGENVNESK